MSESDKAATQRNYFIDFDAMDGFQFSKITSSKGSLAEGDKIFVGRVTKKPGSGSQLHRHQFEQFNYVLKGALRALVDGQEQLVTAGKMVHIPANTPHSTVAGTDEDCVYLMIKERTPLHVYGVPEDPNAAEPRYDVGYEPDHKQP